MGIKFVNPTKDSHSRNDTMGSVIMSFNEDTRVKIPAILHFIDYVINTSHFQT